MKLAKTPRVSRRGMLTGAGAGIAAASVGIADAEADERFDVAIVGAGASGLAAARALTEAGKHVVVLEARDRVGGRLLGGTIAGQHVDLGAMWVGPTQTRALALADAHGLTAYASPVEGRSVTEFDGVQRQAMGGEMALAPETMPHFYAALGQLDAMSRQTPTEAPWRAALAREWDSVTLASWIEANVADAGARGAIAALARAILSSEPSQISLLYFLFYLHSGDDIATLSAIGDGAQKWLYREGLYQLPQRMAAGSRGVRLNTPVRAIAQSDRGVAITSDHGSLYAQRVIVALAPALVSRIAFSPALPAAREALQQRFPMGSVIKFWLAYRQPFWRAQGLSGFALTDQSAASLFVDTTRDHGGPGLLAGFIEGEQAITWSARGRPARAAMVSQTAARLFGPEARRVLDYVDHDWPAEEWSRGCYTGVLGPGALSLYGETLRAPFGRVHWAGTETATVWAGYVEGALRAGERAAHEILDAG